MKDYYPVSYISRLRMGIDGEGIRTLVIFHDCSLRCKYCINAFTWDGSEEPRMMSAQELYNDILIDRLYMLATNGGVTFGGGEPLLHSKAIKEFAEINKGQFTIFVETALNVPRENLEQVVECIDVYYIDIKTIDPVIYKQYTGGEFQRAMDNLQYLVGKIGTERVRVRIPLIPGMTNKEDQKKTRDTLKKEFGITMFDLFNYIITTTDKT